jgi:putative transposase
MVLDDKAREQLALFRYGLIADLIHRAPGERNLFPLLREKAERVYEIPGSRRTRVAAETIRDWLMAYRRGGFDALRPRRRGRFHRVSPTCCASSRRTPRHSRCRR